jgi:hypothetical protein
LKCAFRANAQPFQITLSSPKTVAISRAWPLLARAILSAG